MLVLYADGIIEETKEKGRILKGLEASQNRIRFGSSLIRNPQRTDAYQDIYDQIENRLELYDFTVQYITPSSISFYKNGKAWLEYQIINNSTLRRMAPLSKRVQEIEIIQKIIKIQS